MRTVGLVAKGEIIGKKRINVLVKFDTGAARTSIDEEIAKKAGLEFLEKEKLVISSSARKKRKLVKAVIMLFGKKFEIVANTAKRTHSPFKVLVGRDIILGNFVIDISKTHSGPKELDLRPAVAKRLGIK